MVRWPNKKRTFVLFAIDKRPNEGVVYEIDTNTLKSKAIFSYGGKNLSEEFDLSYGPAEFINNTKQYVAFKISECIECSMYDESPEEPVVIVNTVTYKYKIMGLIGNITINEQEEIFTYQQLKEVEVSCEERGNVGWCIGKNGGSIKEYQPSGEILTESLP